MDWIERLFHFSPDNGSGATEIAIGVVLFLAAASVAIVWRIRHGLKNR